MTAVSRTFAIALAMLAPALAPVHAQAAEPRPVTGITNLHALAGGGTPFITVPRGIASVEVIESIGYDPEVMTQARAYDEADRIARNTNAQVERLIGALAAGSSIQAVSQTTLAGAVPAGLQFTRTTIATYANGCARSVSYTTDGTGAAPKVSDVATIGC